jgi:poly-gamma-glutamate capsule biosynthesis protein CapA/YwtB (metallophosphatase superfamily)
MRTQCLTALALFLAACDSFDFGRVTGRTNPPPSAVPSAAVPREPGSASAESPELAEGELVLVLGGDVALGGNVKAWLSADKKYDPLAGLRPILEGTDLAIASLVSPITEQAMGTARGASPVGPPLGADALARSGLRIMDVGSERLWSSGKRAFIDTLSNLSRTGVLAAGASGDARSAWEPARLVVRGKTITVIATAIWPPKDPSLGEARERVALSDPARLLESIRAATKNDAFVIVSQGGAAEYVESPPPEEIALARSAIEAGAGAVLVHGAHVPLGVTWVDGHPIFYGLGNLVADGDPKNPWTGRGFVAKVSLTKRGVGPVDLCPFLIGDGEPKLLMGSSRTTEEGIFKRAIERLSAPLGGVSVGEPDLHSCLRITPRAVPPP